MYSLVGDASVAKFGLNERERRKGATSRAEEESPMEALACKESIVAALKGSYTNAQNA